MSDRHIIENIKVRYWFTGLMQRSGCKAASRLEKIVEPLSDPKIDPRTPLRNKWKNYKKGINTPRSSLLKKVEVKFPGSSKEINHPIWEILKLNNPCMDDLDKWFLQLSPKFQAVVYRSSNGDIANSCTRKKVSEKLIEKLCKLASLDSLAALTLYWVEAKNNGQHDKEVLLATGIYQILLMLGKDLMSRKIADPLFLYIRSIIFEKTNWGGGYFAISPFEYLWCSTMLYESVNRNPRFRHTSNWPLKCTGMYRLMNGENGLDFKFCLSPLILPNWDSGPPTNKEWNYWTHRYAEWTWGWIHLSLDYDGMYPDDFLWDLISITLFIHRVDDMAGNQQSINEIEYSKQEFNELLTYTNTIARLSVSMFIKLIS